MTGRCGVSSGWCSGGVLSCLGGVSQSGVCGEGTASSCAALERGSCRGCAGCTGSCKGSVQEPCLLCILRSVPAGAEPAVVAVVGLGAAWGASPAWPVLRQCVPVSGGAVPVPAPLLSLRDEG